MEKSRICCNHKPCRGRGRTNYCYSPLCTLIVQIFSTAPLPPPPLPPRIYVTDPEGLIKLPIKSEMVFS